MKSHAIFSFRIYYSSPDSSHFIITRLIIVILFHIRLEGPHIIIIIGRTVTHKVDLENTELTHDFPLTETNLQFNNIVSITNEDALRSFTSYKQKVPESQLNQSALLQGGTGFFTRIDLPGLSSMKALKQQGQIVKATLQVGVKTESHQTQAPPTTLYLLEADKINQLSSYTVNSSDNTVTGILSKTTSLYEESYTYTFDIPYFLMAAQWNSGWQVAADYSLAKWALLNQSSTLNGTFHDSQTFGAGVSWSNPKNKHKRINQMNWQAGAFYTDGLISINGTRIDERGFSAGVSVPVSNHGNRLHLSYQYSVKGTTDNGLIEERYHKFKLSFSIIEHWFAKQKFY